MANPISTTVVKVYEYPVKRFGMFKVVTDNDTLASILFIRDQADKTAHQSEVAEMTSNNLDFMKGLYLALGEFFTDRGIDPKK